MSIMMSIISMNFTSCSGGDSNGGNNDKGGLGGGEWYMSGLYYTMDQLNQSMYDLFNGDWSNCPDNCFDSDGKLNVTYQQPSTFSVSLDGYLRIVTYAPQKLTTDGFKFIQIVNSNTLIVYFEGAIYKANHQYGTKVYELEGNKYTGPLAVFADDPRYLTYTRDGNYLNVTIEGKNEKLAISDNSLILDNIKFDKISTAKSMSTTNIVDNSSPNPNNNDNLKSYSSCPDENHPHLIDLGLSSGTKWACCNIDANTPGQYGNRYAWGETTSKNDFNWSNYKYSYNNIGTDISGTQYDVAHEKWGGSWRMPTKEQFEELLNNTTSEWFVTKKNVIGRKFIGKNGNMIFLPLLHSEAKGAFYWTSTNSKTQSSQSYKLFFSTDSRTVEINASNHCDGNSIRPVQDNNAGGTYSQSAFINLLAGTSSKAWTWDTSTTGTCWGNMGYCGGSGQDVGTSGLGQWWGVTSEDDFISQRSQVDGELAADYFMDSYMVFSHDGTINSYNPKDIVFRKGTFQLEDIKNNSWKVANLHTTAGSILWPFQINWKTNGYDPYPTTFEVVYLTDSKLCLVYPDGGDFNSIGNWGEATYWHFKAKGTGKKHYIYGENSQKEPPFSPAIWDSSEMRFNSTEGKHFPTLSDEIYFGQKTLIVEVSNASSDCKARIMNGWWSSTYAENIPIHSGRWEINITEKMAKECAQGGEGKDLTLMITDGSCTINSVYYEE